MRTRECHDRREAWIAVKIIGRCSPPPMCATDCIIIEAPGGDIVHVRARELRKA